MLDYEERTGEKLTYAKMAERTNVSPNTLSRMATGSVRKVGVGTLERLLRFFECQPNDLMVLVED